MFGFFRKKKAASPDVPDLNFVVNRAAFHYACEALQNDTSDGRQVAALVLYVNETGSAVVKIANDKDSSIPERPIREFLEDGNIEHVSVQTIVPGSVGKLLAGDLVSFMRPKELEAAPVLLGVVTARLQPIYSVRNGGWKIAAPRMPS